MHISVGVCFEINHMCSLVSLVGVQSALLGSSQPCWGPPATTVVIRSRHIRALVDLQGLFCTPAEIPQRVPHACTGPPLVEGGYIASC
jgi:hypothetical protein